MSNIFNILKSFDRDGDGQITANGMISCNALNIDESEDIYFF